MFPQIKRKKTKPVFIGDVGIGGDYPIRVQSMTNTDTKDVKATLSQIEKLAQAGCEVVRVAIPDEKSLEALKEITKNSPLPVVADIHFATLFAEKAVKHGAKGIRINPGTFKKKEHLERIVKICKDYNTCIRIGINAGSLEKEFIEKYKGPTPPAMVESALKWLDKIIGDFGYENVKVSLKSSNWWHTVQAYRMFSEKSDVPLHIGVTEAGGLIPGTIKNTMAITLLLLEGIGDTIRVSLTADPVEEVYVAYEILKNLGIRRIYPDIISCPVCGRCEIDLMNIYKKVEKEIKNLKADLTIAIMGCVVNGPGEAQHADLGITGAKGFGFIFKKGKIIKKVPEEHLITEFLKELQNYLKEHPEKCLN